MEAAVDTARRTVDAREMAAMPRFTHLPPAYLQHATLLYVMFALVEGLH